MESKNLEGACQKKLASKKKLGRGGRRETLQDQYSPKRIVTQERKDRSGGMGCKEKCM